MKFKFMLLASVSSLVIVLDQLTKLVIYTKYHIGQSTIVIENWFNITYVRNFGAAFGFLADSAPAFRDVFFLVIPPIALLLILSILKTVDDKDRLQSLALSLIFGGAIGNYIDRLRFGFVVDFLDFHIKNIYSWPAFNVADMAIVGGVMALVYQMIFLDGKDPKKGDPKKPTSLSKNKKASA